MGVLKRYSGNLPESNLEGIVMEERRKLRLRETDF